MNLVKWHGPSKGLERRNLLMPSLESIFDEFFNGSLMPREFAGYVPSVNISETDKAYEVEVSAPGFEKKDFNIQIEEGMLLISAEHKSERKEEDKQYMRREFNYGSFRRSFNIGMEVNEDKIDARYENGILKILLPKKEVTPAKTARQIRIS